MADTLKADIAKELNITARRNDSFQLSLQVKDSGGNIDMDTLRGSVYPNYQAKMTIINPSNDRVLNIYSYYWRDVVPTNGSAVHPLNAQPTSSTEGHWSGTAADDINMGIYLLAQTTAGSTTQAATITVPHEYMDFQSGVYKYDLQIRKQTTGSATDDASAEFTTWLFGNFTLNADITQS
jgi:hypothetical protein